MMKKLCLLLFLTIPAWPNACTLAWTGNLSASGGHWTGTGCTGGSYIPIAGDSTIISNTYTLTVDQNWTVGSSPANNGVAAISVGTSGSVTVNTGITLKLLGNFTWTYGGASNSTALQMNAGSTLVFDSSGAASASTTRYRYGGTGSSGSGGFRDFVANGTSASRVTVTSCSSISTASCGSPGTPGLAGQFRSGTSSTGATPDDGQRMVVTYTDWSYIGDAAAFGEAFAPLEFTGDAGSYSVSYATCNYCGPFFTNAINFSSAQTVLFDHWLFTNSLGHGIELGGEALTTGSRTFRHNVFDLRWNDSDGACSSSQNQPGFTFQDNYFSNGWCASGTKTAVAMTDTFWRVLSNANPQWQFPNGNVTGAYFLSDVTSGAEYHLSQSATTTSQTISGIINDTPDDATGQAGYQFLPPTASASPITISWNNNLLLPTKTGSNHASLNGCTSVLPANTNPTMNLNHNTWTGPTVGSAGMITLDEGAACLAPFNQLRSTLMWAKSGTYSKAGVVQITTLSTTPITTITDNAADSSSHLTLTNPSCSNCTNQANGYAAKWTSTPGASDFIAAPYFADTTRNVATWDTAYLHTAAGTQWTSGLGTLAYGYIVSDPQATVYGGATINYRCYVLAGCNTATTATEPNIGASWRTQWEFASLADIRTATAAGTLYNGSTAIQALEAWVKQGFTPQNPALWCSGHDGEAVGAVPFCAAGKLLLGTLGVM
jgi:hypothetical protein